MSAVNSYGTGLATLNLSLVNDAVAHPSPPIIQGAVIAMAVDASGNRYVTGHFSGTLDFNPGVGADVKASQGTSIDVFITRFNADGSYAWTQTFGGSGDDYPSGIAVSGTAVYVSGHFASQDAGFGGLGSVACVGEVNAFILALNAATGAPITGFAKGGAQTFGGNQSVGDFAWAITASNTTVYVAGLLSSSNAGLWQRWNVQLVGQLRHIYFGIECRHGYGRSGLRGEWGSDLWRIGR